YHDRAQAEHRADEGEEETDGTGERRKEAGRRGPGRRQRQTRSQTGQAEEVEGGMIWKGRVARSRFGAKSIGGGLRPQPNGRNSKIPRRSEEHTSELQSPDHLV